MSHAVPALRSRFNRHATATQVTEGIDLAGKTILITGVNSGLGFESMRVLAGRGAHVIGAARSLESATEACARVEGQTTPVACELSELARVADCADTVHAMGLPIDVLMCNAGIMALPGPVVKNGLELQFLTNHLGHFVLLNRLSDLIHQAEAGRVVLLSSLGHRHSVKGGIDFDNLDAHRSYDPWQFYGQSKLANLLTSNELARRLMGSKATSNALHPGVIRTGLSRNTAGMAAQLISIMTRPFERDVGQGAATQCYLAAHRDLKRVSGYYFADCNPATPGRHGRDAKLARRLWHVSEELASAYL